MSNNLLSKDLEVNLHDAWEDLIESYIFSMFLLHGDVLKSLHEYQSAGSVSEILLLTADDNYEALPLIPEFFIRPYLYDTELLSISLSPVIDRWKELLTAGGNEELNPKEEEAASQFEERRERYSDLFLRYDISCAETLSIIYHEDILEDIEDLNMTQFEATEMWLKDNYDIHPVAAACEGLSLLSSNYEETIVFLTTLGDISRQTAELLLGTTQGFPRKWYKDNENCEMDVRALAEIVPDIVGWEDYTPSLASAENFILQYYGEGLIEDIHFKTVNSYEFESELGDAKLEDIMLLPPACDAIRFFFGSDMDLRTRMDEIIQGTLRYERSYKELEDEL